MGLLSWLRRRRRAERATPVPAPEAPRQADGEKAEAPRPLDKETHEARAQAHGRSHLTG